MGPDPEPLPPAPGAEEPDCAGLDATGVLSRVTLIFAAGLGGATVAGATVETLTNAPIPRGCEAVAPPPEPLDDRMKAPIKRATTPT